jgi:tripartite-type tricarboxylate transporter receptor subunit TctC
VNFRWRRACLAAHAYNNNGGNNAINIQPGKKNVRELVALAKARPGELNYTSGGNGSPQHIAMEMFKAASGAKLTHVPCEGATQATLDVIGGQIPVMFTATSLVISHIRDGKLHALAAGGAKRSALLPAMPTVSESGAADYDFNTWMAIFAPVNTPKDIIARLNAEALKALKAPDVRERLIAQGFEVYGTAPEQVAALTRTRLAQMARVIREAGIVVE